ncbi:MAG TPA: hypothetical protein VGY57_01925 [Vicinamibacterales bacterium]|jgi:hypothetical protein|nr:hypothetical protein [Vicinamibacterales bacterium]
MTTQTDDTRQILDMLSQGKITVDEADRLVKAVCGAQPAAETSADASTDAAERRRWIRINVHKLPKDASQKPRDVNIRVPIAAVKGGLRLGAIIAEFAGEKTKQRMKEQGFDVDLSKINGPDFESFLKTLDDMNIEVDDGKSQVRITCE